MLGLLTSSIKYWMTETGCLQRLQGVLMYAITVCPICVVSAQSDSNLHAAASLFHKMLRNTSISKFFMNKIPLFITPALACQTGLMSSIAHNESHSGM